MILEIWCLSKVRTRSAGRIGDFRNLLIAFLLKAHTYYPTYDIGAYYSDWTLAALCWIFFMKTFYNVIISILCCAKEARASIVLDWLNECNLSRKIVKNYRIIALNRAKIILPEVCMRCITSDVMCKKYILKATLYAHQICHQDLLVLKVILLNTRNPAWFLILASLLERRMQRVNFWLPLRTIVCCIKLYFGAVQLSRVSPTEWLERLN